MIEFMPPLSGPAEPPHAGDPPSPSSAVRLADLLEADGGPGTRQELPSARRLITEGRPTRRFLFVVKGELRVTVDGHEVARLRPGDWCGEIGLLQRLTTNDGRATASVSTAVESEVISLAPWEFKSVIDRHPELVGELIATAEVRLLRANALPAA